MNLIASQYTLEASDVPVVTPEVLRAFDGPFEAVVFDVGGDPVGATALGQYYHRFCMIPAEELEILFIVNTRRPLTQTSEEISEMLDKIQRTSRLKVTGLVNNTNLAAESDLGLLDEGQEILKDVSESWKIPIRYYGVQKKLYGEAAGSETRRYQGNPILLELYTRLEWLDFVPCQSIGGNVNGYEYDCDNYYSPGNCCVCDRNYSPVHNCSTVLPGHGNLWDHVF